MRGRRDSVDPDYFRIEATAELIKYVRTAPPGSAIAKAREFGIDVDALLIKLATTTVWERLAAHDRRTEEIRALRARAGKTT